MLDNYPEPKKGSAAIDFINSKEFMAKHKAIKDQKKKKAAEKMKESPKSWEERVGKKYLNAVEERVNGKNKSRLWKK